jgi:hypothetical protein
MAKDETPNATFFHREDSPTAASSHNRLFGNSGRMAYKVMVSAGMGMIPFIVEASTGDEAAELAVGANGQYPGAKVAHVEPAAQKAA